MSYLAQGKRRHRVNVEEVVRVILVLHGAGLRRFAAFARSRRAGEPAMFIAWLRVFLSKLDVFGSRGGHSSVFICGQYPLNLLQIASDGKPGPWWPLCRHSVGLRPRCFSSVGVPH